MKFLRVFLLLLAVAGIVWLFTRPTEMPVSPRVAEVRKTAEERAKHKPSPLRPGSSADATLIRNLLAEDLSNRTFPFSTVVEATSGKKIIPLDSSAPHRRTAAAIEAALSEILPDLSQPSSPVRQLRRINEASRFFEDALLEKLNATPGFRCEIPPTRSGSPQRSGYPDLRLTDLESGAVFYLDPKLVERTSTASTLRSFYFEPKNQTLKITENAVHLLIGIEHDGNSPDWTFTGWRIVDLSTLRVRLKAEFQASNADLYNETGLSLPSPPR